MRLHCLIITIDLYWDPTAPWFHGKSLVWNIPGKLFLELRVITIHSYLPNNEDLSKKLRPSYHSLLCLIWAYKRTMNMCNSQVNAILEIVHKMLGKCLWTFELDERYLGKDDPLDKFLSATAQCAILSTTERTTLEVLLGQLVFGEDVILPIPRPFNKSKRGPTNTMQETTLWQYQSNWL